MNADVRAQFEAWARSEFLSVHRHGDSGPYSHPRTFSAWEAWQAALAARQPVASNQPAGNSGQLGVDGQAVGQEPVCTECGTPVLFECTGCSRSNYPPYMQGPIGEIVYSGEGGLQIEFYDGKPLAPMKLYAAPREQAVDLGQLPDGWHLSKKATCYQLSHGNDIVGNLVGPDAEENAAIIARVLDSKAMGND